MPVLFRPPVAKVGAAEALEQPGIINLTFYFSQSSGDVNTTAAHEADALDGERSKRRSSSRSVHRKELHMKVEPQPVTEAMISYSCVSH